MKLNVLFWLTKCYGGSDIYYQRLRNNFKKVRATIHYSDSFLRYLPLLPQIIRCNNIDILHTDAGFNIKIINKIPLIVTVHHLIWDERYWHYLNSKEKIYYSILENFFEKSLEKADKIIAVSNYTKQAILDNFRDDKIKDKIEVIYNGIDTQEFRPKNDFKEEEHLPIKLLFVGNLTKRKGVDLLPKIINKLGNEYVLYYTSGMRTKNILKHKNMFPLGKLTQDELVEEYNKCDILLLPTRLEGFGYAVAEAMACGRPVVTTNCSSLPELIENKKNGFLCEIDNVDDFAEKIKILGNNPKLRIKMGEFNRKKAVEKFGIGEMVKKIENLYSDIKNENFNNSSSI